MPESGPEPRLHELLARWMAEGLIDAGQAARIAAAEAARGESTGAPVPADRGVADRQPSDPATRRFPLVVEALGYLGGALAIVAGFAMIPLLSQDIRTSAQLAIASVAAVGSWAGGAMLRVGDEPAFRRLRAVLWLLSAASVATFVSQIATQVWGFDRTHTALVVSAITAVYAGLLWWRSRTVIQHLAAFAATEVLFGAGIARLAPDTHAWGPGLAVWGTSLLWGAASQRGYLLPLAAGYVAAGTGLLVGAELTMGTAAGHVLALATVAGLLAAGVALRRVVLLSFGAVGVIVMVPQTTARYLPASAGAPLAVFVVGLSLIAVALWLAKSRKRQPPI